MNHGKCYWIGKVEVYWGEGPLQMKEKLIKNINHNRPKQIVMQEMKFKPYKL